MKEDTFGMNDEDWHVYRSIVSSCAKRASLLFESETVDHSAKMPVVCLVRFALGTRTHTHTHTHTHARTHARSHGRTHALWLRAVKMV